METKRFLCVKEKFLFFAELSLQIPMVAGKIARGACYFLSGVMQGSVKSTEVHKGVEVTNQDYRALMKAAILAADSTAKIIEPWDLVGQMCMELYPADKPKEEYFREDEDVQKAFQLCVDQAGASDVVVSYLPEASMGSAVEIHAAKLAGKRVIAIAPDRMGQNWVVRSYADNKLASIDELAALLTSLLE